MLDWNTVAAQVIGEMPHPRAPGLKVKELPTAIKLATKARYGGHASMTEASLFWQDFQGMNSKLSAQGKMPLTPEDFEHTLDRIAPVSFAFHGRPPTMEEIARHREAAPADVRKFYADMPDKHYPDVTAGDMAKYMALADPFSRDHLDRPPAKLEARRFAHASLSMDAIDKYYRSVKQDGTQDQVGPHPGQPGSGDAGGQPNDPRAAGPALGRQGTAAGGANGLPARRADGSSQ